MGTLTMSTLRGQKNQISFIGNMRCAK
uniref:Uncharacterized protein n=1 Tax=Arundo donax TaxID=35708 RepID=A0A0A9ESJ9_ARUDO